MTVIRAISNDVSYALAPYDFNLIVVGLEEAQGGHFSVLHTLRRTYVTTPIIVVGRQLAQPDLERCRQFAVHAAIEMPRRAAELKIAIISIVQQYLQCAWTNKFLSVMTSVLGQFA